MLNPNLPLKSNRKLNTDVWWLAGGEKHALIPLEGITRAMQLDCTVWTVGCIFKKMKYIRTPVEHAMHQFFET